MDLSSISPTLLVASLMVAATPILLASIGELVVEKSGVLNLGVEGMMIIGAIAGFAAAVGWWAGKKKRRDGDADAFESEGRELARCGHQRDARPALKGVREQSARRCDGCFIVQTSKSTQKPDSNSGPAD